MIIRPLGGILAASLAITTVACGGKDKKAKTGPEGAMDNSSPAALTIPKVDAELCAPKGKKVQTFDLNRDNQADVWKLYRIKEQGGTTLEILTCKQVDYDHDGRKDYVAIYRETGELLAEEFDFTFEGHIDARRHYNKESGTVYLVERDSDHDKKPDVWEKFDRQGTIESVRRDRNADGKPDVWEEYEKGVLVSILYDDDYDNRVDRREVRAKAEEKKEKAEEERPVIEDEKKPENPGSGTATGTTKPPQ